MNLTMGRPTSGFRLASTLSAEDSALVDPPVAYHVDRDLGFRVEGLVI